MKKIISLFMVYLIMSISFSSLSFGAEALNEEQVLKGIQENNFLTVKLNFWNEEEEKSHEALALQKDDIYYRLLISDTSLKLFEVEKTNKCENCYVYNEGSTFKYDLVTGLENIISILTKGGFKKKESVVNTGPVDTKNFVVEMVRQDPETYSAVLSQFKKPVSIIFSVKSKTNLEVQGFNLNDEECDKEENNWRCELLTRDSKQNRNYMILYDGKIETGSVSFEVKIDDGSAGLNSPLDYFGGLISGARQNYYGGRVESSLSKSVDRILDVVEPIYKFLWVSCTLFRTLMMVKSGGGIEWMVKKELREDFDFSGNITKEQYSPEYEMFKKFCDPIECPTNKGGNCQDLDVSPFNAGLIKNVKQCNPPCLTGIRYSLLILKEGLELSYNACKTRSRTSGFNLFECEVELASIVCDSMYGTTLPSGLGGFGSLFGGRVQDTQTMITSFLSGGMDFSNLLDIGQIKKDTEDRDISEFCKQASRMKMVSPLLNGFGNLGSGFGDIFGRGFDNRDPYGSTRVTGSSTCNIFDVTVEVVEEDKFKYSYKYSVQVAEREKVDYRIELDNKKIDENVITRDVNNRENSVIYNEKFDNICIKCVLYEGDRFLRETERCSSIR